MKGLLRLAFLAVAVLLAQGTWALAGVTGSLNGTVLLEGTSTPVADAAVTASAASQTSTTKTDAGGHFSFVSLVPDTYTVTVTKENVIEQTVQRGVTIVADQVVNLVVQAKKFVKTLATVTTRAGGTNLVQPGTTANVYSVDTRAQARTAVLGGGGGADQGYSALAALPGAYIAPGQAGWYQTVNIRGGDYDQVGYEFDGIPVNRSFDNYPTTNLSAIGQQELQIYTGAAPAAAEGQGLAGYINQVIKSGTYPGYGTVTLGVGGPALYNKASFELGGGTPDRNFTYYVGVGIINSGARVYDSNNGVSQNATFGLPYDMTFTRSDCAAHNTASEALCYANGANTILGVPAGPGGYYLGGLNLYTPALLEDRESVFNFHIGLPHRNDSGKDDIQLLYDVFQLYNQFYSSANDWGGGPNFFTNNIHGALEGPGQPIFVSGFQSTIPLGTTFASADPTQAANVLNYAYPSEGARGFLGQPIPSNQRGGYDNGNGIYKLQYQHNIGTNAYLRAYGYIYYSWWFIHDPVGAQNLDFGLAPDYELWTHTRGGSLQYVNQLSPQHLLNIEGTYSTASTVRDNNTQMFNFTTSREVMANLVSAANPTNGICYAAAVPNVPRSCLKATRNFGGEGSGGGGDYLAFADVQGGGIPAPPAVCGGPCVWYVSENGPYATFNTVTPRFWAISAQDTWKPTDRLNLNIGVRENIYTFVFTPTGGGTRPFWVNAWNMVSCVNPNFNGGNPVDETTLGFVAGTACSGVSAPGFPAGSFAPATLVNATANGGQITYPEFEPRISGTYTFGPNDVLRFSAGRFSEPANAAFQQYNHLAQDAPDALWGSLFFRFGYNTPNHTIRPSISYNYDLSIEHRFANTNTSFRLTPFLRQTHDQVQQLYIAPTQAFVSGLNVGNETNIGAEFLLNAGDFNANGLAAQISYTYTHSYIKYSPLPNGQTVVAFDNIDIQHYNAFTSGCVGAVASFSTTAPCGPDGANLAHQCFNSAGVGFDGVACTAAMTANPYFGAPIRPLLNPNANYEPYDIVPVGVQLSSVGYVVPHVATLVLQYKRDKWSFIPGLQFHAGQKYGAPETTYGFDPSTCGAPLGSAIAGDLRYPFGGTGGPADAVTCGGNVVMPNPFTGNFDAPGAFTEPSQLTLGMSIQYEASPRITYQLNAANIVNTCFGGTKAAWTYSDQHWCLYGGAPGFFPPVGNFFNPGSTIQTYVKYPYFVNATGDNGIGGIATPFQGSFNVQIKL